MTTPYASMFPCDRDAEDSRRADDREEREARQVEEKGKADINAVLDEILRGKANTKLSGGVAVRSDALLGGLVCNKEFVYENFCSLLKDHTGPCDNPPNAGGEGRELCERTSPPPCSVVHQCPPDGAGVMPCCGRTPFEVPRTDRMTTDADAVTCKPNAAGEAALPAKGDA